MAHIPNDRQIHLELTFKLYLALGFPRIASNTLNMGNKCDAIFIKHQFRYIITRLTASYDEDTI